MNIIHNPIWRSLFAKLLADYLLGKITKEEMLLFMNMTTDIQVTAIVQEALRRG